MPAFSMLFRQFGLPGKHASLICGSIDFTQGQALGIQRMYAPKIDAVSHIVNVCIVESVNATVAAEIMIHQPFAKLVASQAGSAGNKAKL